MPISSTLIADFLAETKNNGWTQNAKTLYECMNDKQRQIAKECMESKNVYCNL